MEIVLDCRQDLAGWIYLPLAACKTLKPPSPKEHVAWIRIVHEDKVKWSLDLISAHRCSGIMVESCLGRRSLLLYLLDTLRHVWIKKH